MFPADGAGSFARAAAVGGVARLVLLSSLAAALEHERDAGSASQVQVTEQPPEEFAAEMTSYLVGPDVVAMLLAYWSDTVEEPDAPRPPDRLLGRAARTLAEWAPDHAADFEG